MDKLKKNLFLLAFVEGGAVMCVELCSAKILAPYFGTSIYVWASVLGITLTALMSGYYLGGYISSNYKKIETVFWIMLLGGLLVTLTPIISSIILPIMIQFNILQGTVISLICILFFPLMLFGATSPLIINMLTNHAKDSGKSSGNVYAVSTLGGIIVTFTIGFYTFPQFGISITLYVYGLIIIAVSTLLFIVTKTFKIRVLSVIILALLTPVFFNDNDSAQIIHKSEGILGEIKVVDREVKDQNGSVKTNRELMVNNITQSLMEKENPDKNSWDYINILSTNILSFKKGDNVLLLGLGGGTLYKQLINNNLNVDIVELDRRIERLAKEYFYVDKDVPVIVDDARHFIKTTKKKYDIIIYDLYHSETPPVHLLTKEAFNEIYNSLNEGGILTINFYGFISGKNGKAARSIYKTLLDQNFEIRLLATQGVEESRNLLFICKKDAFDKLIDEDEIEIKNSEIDLNDAILLSDDKPILEQIYLEAAIMWRRGYNEINTKTFVK